MDYRSHGSSSKKLANRRWFVLRVEESRRLEMLGRCPEKVRRDLKNFLVSKT